MQQRAAPARLWLLSGLVPEFRSELQDVAAGPARQKRASFANGVERGLDRRKHVHAIWRSALPGRPEAQRGGRTPTRSPIATYGCAINEGNVAIPPPDTATPRKTRKSLATILGVSGRSAFAMSVVASAGGGGDQPHALDLTLHAANQCTTN